MNFRNKLRHTLFWVDVIGDSMSPVLLPGKSYLASVFLKPKVGRIIVFKNPQNHNRVMIKKIIKQTNGGFEVAGIRNDSTSSKDIGLVGHRLILGTLFRH